MMARTAKRHDLGFGRLRVAAPCVLFLALCLTMAQGQAPTEVHIGGLYAVAFTNVRERASHFRLALDMINDKTDGWFDDFLPNTQIKYVVDNSGCSSGVALEGAAKQGTPCMQGSSRTPVVATVGATCSGASMSAQDLLKLYKIPMVSYSATSPDLSDKTLYPYFLRTVPSDLAQGKGIATLAKHLGVKRMGLIASDGPYGIGLADQFRAQASQDSIDNPSSAYKTVTKYAEVTVDGKKEAKVDLTMICKVRDLHKEGVKHVFGALQTPDAFFFAVTIYLSGYLKGNDYMFYAPDSWSNDNFNTVSSLPPSSSPPLVSLLTPPLSLSLSLSQDLGRRHHELVLQPSAQHHWRVLVLQRRVKVERRCGRHHPNLPERGHPRERQRRHQLPQDHRNRLWGHRDSHWVRHRRPFQQQFDNHLGFR